MRVPLTLLALVLTALAHAAPVVWQVQDAVQPGGTVMLFGDGFGEQPQVALCRLGDGPAGTQIICSLEGDAAQNIPAVAGDIIPLSMTSTVHLDAARAVDLHCLKAGTGVPAVAQAKIIATRVGTLTGP